MRAGSQSSEQALANIRRAGNDLAVQVKRVVAAGAKYVVVVGPYNLERSPWGASTGQQGFLREMTSQFNNGTEKGGNENGLLNGLVDQGRNVLYVDAALHFNFVTAGPGAYNISNATTPVCTSVDPGPGIGIGANQVNSALCTPSTLLPNVDPSLSLFADPIYFTSRGHVTFGDYAYEQVRRRF